MATTLRLLRRPHIHIHPTLRHSTTSKSTMARPFHSYLVTPADLSTALKQNPNSTTSTGPRTVPVCGSWFLPNDPQRRTGLQVFRSAHIPTARFFDLDAISDTSSPYPHMLPSAETFREAMCSLGINREDIVVVYDTAELGIFSAPRVAWTFRVFGHPAVHVLNNFKLWVEQHYPTETGAAQAVERTEYPLSHPDMSKVIPFEEMKTLVSTRHHTNEPATPSTQPQILDARSPGRFAGTDPEPRPGLPSGHMPGSISVPVPDLLDPTTKAFLPAEELKRVFTSKGVDPSRPLISSCGTGVTAAVVETALMEAGFGGAEAEAEGSGRRVYDGSWTEWAQRVREGEGLIVKG
ncbi:hypothetical protein BAUCODRAFT_35686 [Baudoinia panamericana UAMH 10762]|uniref:Rhodanese domain-containing protein n=1 Tax=Baudoinia panamericana (strain UAMH 10762) TaxID=717646 RepID=M2N6R5_BAUPA|nr:uncharacterized protein BAUCODRAFT_35686 [Baudoinia panamericana UAMH 10762]EMC94470.1 hypothetical protein BAUCODRAFT_35686 [Baudoinia panamericana UAMH 10762]